MTVYKIRKENKDNKEKIKNINENTKGLDTKKYCGKINIKKDGLDFQKEIRDENGINSELGIKD